MTTTTKQKPLITDRSGTLDTAVWTNEANGRTYYNTTLQVSFLKNDEWQSTKISLGKNDLLAAASLLKWADESLAALKDESVSTESPTPRRNRDVEVEIVVQEDTQSSAIRLTRWYDDNGTWKKLVAWLRPQQLLPAARLLERTFDAIDAEQLGKSTTGNDGLESTSFVDEDDIPF